MNEGEACFRIVRLKASEDNYARCISWLSAEETARAARFHFDEHRRAFVLGRGALRALLASELAIAPAEVAFVYGPHGKPALAPALENKARGLRFNASNSGDLAAFAFTSGCDIGIDIERHRALSDLERIAHRFFSPEETAELLALSGEQQIDAFFRCWTRKEAFIKALGGGLSIPLASFQVTLRPGVAARLVSIGGSADAARNWTLSSFDPGPGYAGAVACDAPRLIQPVGPAASLGAAVDELIDAEVRHLRR